MANFTEFLAVQARQRPSQVCVYAPEGDLTFSQLDAMVWQFSAYLKHNGLGPGDLVGLTFSSERLLLVVMLAVARLGATVFSVQGGAIPTELMASEGQRNLKVILTDHPRLRRGQIPVVRVSDGLLAKLASHQVTAYELSNASSPWLLISGSGSTGKPKLVEVSHALVKARMQLYGDFIAPAPGDRILSLIHLDFPSAKNQILNALFSGASVCFFDRTQESALSVCRQYDVTVVYCAVIHVELMLKEFARTGQEVWPALRALVPAGSLVSSSLRQRAGKVFGSALVVRYGTVETGPISDSYSPDVFETERTVGRPLSGVVVEIVDMNQQRLAANQVGLIRIRSPGMVHSYVMDAVASSRSFQGGWFYPGDIGMLSSDGQIIFRGRADHMMVLNGVNIYPAEIETVICGHPAVQDAAAMPIRSELHQEIPVCAVELFDDAEASEQELSNYCIERMGFRAPKRIVQVDRIPRTDQGKLNRAELARQLAAMLGKRHS